MITEPLDLTNPDDSLLRRLARQSLENTASPMFLIKNFGFEQLLQSVIARASSENTCLSDGKSHFDLKTEHTQDDPLFDEFRDEMKALATRVATILFGEESAAGVQLDGPLSVKSYVGESDESRTDDIRLGAHVDGNMFTILWSNAPGLQVLKPEKNVNAEDLMFYGMPLIGVAPSLEVKEEDFVDVEAEWSSGNVMLVTVGRSWFSSTNALTNNSDLNVKCPVLHRVAFPACDHVRYSVPFLVSCVPVEKE